jgi:hypothetical protein
VAPRVADGGEMADAVAALSPPGAATAAGATIVCE